MDLCIFELVIQATDLGLTDKLKNELCQDFANTLMLIIKPTCLTSRGVFMHRFRSLCGSPVVDDDGH